MDLLSHFKMLAYYNRIANGRLYAQCALLDDDEYRKQRQGSFGSIHALLNHMLLGDQIWMARFEGGGEVTPPLNTVLFEKFSDLQQARAKQDARIEKFFALAEPEFLAGSIHYTNSKGIAYVESVSVAVGHFFNHQTHHRGQMHVMLSQTPVGPPSLDLHRIVNP